MPRSPPTLTGVHDLLRPVLDIPHGGCNHALDGAGLLCVLLRYDDMSKPCSQNLLL